MRALTLLAALALVSTALPLAGAHPVPALAAGCGGTAPAFHACSTGSHTPVVHVQHGVGAGMGYVGTLTSTIDWGTGQHTITCHIDGSGNMPDCSDEVTGTPPFVATPYTHTCASYDLQTTTSGGSGFWSCSTSHI